MRAAKGRKLALLLFAFVIVMFGVSVTLIMLGIGIPGLAWEQV